MKKSIFLLVNGNGDDINLEPIGGAADGGMLYALNGIFDEVELLALARRLTEKFGDHHLASDVQSVLSKVSHGKSKISHGKSKAPRGKRGE